MHRAAAVPPELSRAPGRRERLFAIPRPLSGNSILIIFRLAIYHRLAEGQRLAIHVLGLDVTSNASVQAAVGGLDCEVRDPGYFREAPAGGRPRPRWYSANAREQERDDSSGKAAQKMPFRRPVGFAHRTMP